jgi:hypothetical protein
MPRVWFQRVGNLPVGDAVPDTIFGGCPIKRVMLRSESRCGLQADGLPQTRQRIVTQATTKCLTEKLCRWRRQDIARPGNPA